MLPVHRVKPRRLCQTISCSSLHEEYAGVAPNMISQLLDHACASLGVFPSQKSRYLSSLMSNEALPRLLLLLLLLRTRVVAVLCMRQLAR